MAAAAYSALYALQHRGQESCGIAVNDDGVIQGHRDLGLVNEVFTPAVLGSLANPNAHMATGHVRYATSGSRIRANAQPMIVRHGRGTMALCHNGNLTNAIELRRQLENEGAIFHGSSDTEVICYLITRNRLRMGSIETAISKTMDVLEGAYSLVIMSATKLIAVRDPRGYRPLCIGTLPGGGYVFASESCALDAVGATLLRDVEPGEIVVADAKTGELRSITDHVGRPDTQNLTAEGVTKAAVETVAENASDGVIAPLLYMLIGGAPLALTYKAINTMDSMLGYKNEKYLSFGRIPAKLDDAANYLPSRLAGLLWCAAAALTGNSAKGAWRIWRRDRRNHASPNSAQTESACAGALGVQLAGPAYYFGEYYPKPTIGDALRPIEPEDIRRANKMMYAESLLALLLGLAIRGVIL